MPTEIETGQNWSAWVPGRRQWLLAKVVRYEGGQATLKSDGRYGILRGEDEQKADDATMLSNSNLFRFVASRA